MKANAICATLALAFTPLLACEDQGPTPLPSDLSVEVVASGLSSPVFLTSPPDDDRLFVVEQTGRIRVIKNGQLLATPYLNIATKIVSGGERGLLGLAFHPAFATNGLFYVNYTNPSNNTIIERYQATPSSDVADPNSGSLVLEITQPSFTNHKGGMLAFGPDGMLWIATGDGGSGGDPQNNGQTLTTALGKMLRIDVNVAGVPYGIPTNNPFAGHATNRREIWGWGLRNPWRFSFDRETDELYVADVGQGTWEEVNVVPSTQASVNYGWRLMEGNHCFNPTTCSPAGLTIPVHEYDHSDGNCSVTGGYVYRGSAIPDIRGRYFYSDFCGGFLKSFRFENGSAVEHVTWDVGSLGNVTSFGEDADGELYILGSGTVYRLIP